MTQLSDRVGIWTQDKLGELHLYRMGNLVWFGGWPCLWVDKSIEVYTPLTISTTWTLRLSDGASGDVFDAWTQMQAILERLDTAAREARRQEEQSEADDRDYARQREQENRLAQELNERRGEP